MLYKKCVFYNLRPNILRMDYYLKAQMIDSKFGTDGTPRLSNKLNIYETSSNCFNRSPIKNIYVEPTRFVVVCR